MSPHQAGFGTSYTWRVPDEHRGNGLADEISGYLKISPGEVITLIDFGSVYVRKRIERNPSTKLAGGEEITVNFPAHGIRKFYEIDPSRIIYRDRFFLAYDKESGIPSQQTPSDAYNNVFAGLLRYLEKERSSGGHGPYAALHHRLDMETSGVMLFALAREVNRTIGAAFQKRRILKEYLAWVEGMPGKDGWTENRDIGKKGDKYVAVPSGRGLGAVTDFGVIHREAGRSLILAVPHTGRTHQIRIHLAAAGYPIVGDRAYGAAPAGRLFLHALRLTLKHPVRGGPVVLEAPISAEWPSAAGQVIPPAPRA